ncbi:FecR family protein [Pseudomonas proteolytica]|uniref:FecR domain-containing protein n=1 Tax=Pseudomonas proteolytica TaxID=219574 RepID=UPI001472FE6E|nr:FecR family protein [Pseudomonas proteolytica]NMZ06631.1 FecR family protein [Pseudomonas proteolytica]
MIAPDDVLDQAVGWLVRIESNGATPEVLEACQRWRQANALHETVWQALQKSDATFQSLAALPGTVALDTLERLNGNHHSRRQALKLLGVGLLACGVTGWSLRESTLVPWGADYATGVGERRQFLLSDGTRLQLNTASTVDVQLGAQRRLITLRRGEIFIDTGKDSAEPGGRRSFWVSTRHAQLQAIGTAFAVRDEQQGTRLRVEDGVVVIQGAGEPVLVAAGEEYLIDANGSHRVQVSTLNASAWTRGQLVAKRMHLGDLSAELARYRHGWLHCDPAIAQLEVSGVFQLDDIDRALSALSDSLPVRIERFTPLWTRVVAR